MVLRAHNRRFHEMARAIQHVTTAEDLAAFLFDFSDRGTIALHRGLVDERPHEHVRLQRMPDVDLGVGFYQFAGQFVVARLVHKETSGGGAALAGCADGAEQDGPHGHVQISCFIDDDGIVAAEFKEASSQTPADRRGDMAPDCDRSGEGNERQALVLHHRLGEIRLVGDDE